MKCAYFKNGAIYIGKSPLPIPLHDEILIKVFAIGINRADLLQMQGLYPGDCNTFAKIDGSQYPIPGLEVSGMCVQTGKRVMALLSGGGYAEYVCVNQNAVIEVPDSINDETAAAIPEALITVWLNLYKIGQLKLPLILNNARLYNEQNTNFIDAVLIHGGSSGIGTLATQYALFSGYDVYTTAREANKLKFFTKMSNIANKFSIYDEQRKIINRCKTNINSLYILSYKDDFANYINSSSSVSYILDILGAPYLNQNLKSLNRYGKLVSIALMGGAKSEVNLGSLLLKNIHIIGSTLRSKSIKEKIALIKEAKQYLLPLIESQEVQIVIDQIFQFNDVKNAYSRMLSREHIGKIILKIH